MAVAQLRGVKFHLHPDGHYQPVITKDSNVSTAHNALRDVYLWLRYNGASEYLDAMVELGAKIFKRAKY